MTPREKAVLRAAQVFGESRSYSALWDAIVTAYELVFRAEDEQCKTCEQRKIDTDA